MLPLLNIVTRTYKPTTYYEEENRMALGDFKMELEGIMQDAPNEMVRQKLMETMNMM